MEEIIVEIPQYIREYQVSQSQRPVYYVLDSSTGKIKSTSKRNKVPVKLFTDSYPYGHSLDSKKYKLCVFRANKFVGEYAPQIQVLKKTDHIRVCDINFQPLIANFKNVGTPKIRVIKGQDIYNGNIREEQRAQMMNKIKEQMRPIIQKMPVITQYPITIDCELHDTVKNKYDRVLDTDIEGRIWDVDNRGFPYGKAFCDVLQELSKVVNDDRLHITKPPLGVLFCPLPDNDDTQRKLKFIIKHDDREIIKNNKFYGKK